MRIDASDFEVVQCSYKEISIIVYDERRLILSFPTSFSPDCMLPFVKVPCFLTSKKLKISSFSIKLYKLLTLLTLFLFSRGL